ncbi:MAG: shikimate kinase [Elusimicrobia bacterium]|nr:shikimate kinase [Elusimicrobiota bacterium]
MNIVLTGFMGTGKSEVGKLLAEKLGRQFFDIDEIIEKETRMKISSIFKNKGEPYFRDLETKTIKLVSLQNEAVIACGGGAVLRTENMYELEKTGIIVCLTATPEKIFERVKNEKHRPLLKEKNLLLNIKEILQKREEHYKRCFVSVDTTNSSPAEVARTILDNPQIKKRLNYK